MLEKTILSNLILNEEFCRKVFPYLKDDYFDDLVLRSVFETASDYLEKYKEPPSLEALKIAVDKRKDLTEDTYQGVHQLVDSMSIDKETQLEFLLDETEKFCQDKDLYNSIRKSILILDGQDKELDKGEIPKLLSDSLGISFDSSVGHDFLEDTDDRYEHYHRKEERIPFDIDIFNKITKGGIPRKSMTVLLATTGGGKSLLKCHWAANHLMYGKNVLYITMEMAAEEIGRRIDANIMDITLDEVAELPRDVFDKRMARLKGKTTGKLIVKEFPTGSAHSGHFRHLLNELQLKKNFKPDVIFLDYLNICSSARVKGAAAANSYTLVKSIAEEVRGLAMEFNCAVVTSSQYNRDAYGNSDVDLTNTSESMGITHTADCILGLVGSEYLDEMNQLMIKQLKNRWGDISYYRRFLVGIERAKMKIYELEESAQDNIQTEAPSGGGGHQGKKNFNDDGPVFDKTDIGMRLNKRKPGSKSVFGDVALT
jgi:replicative DNA helicase|tara:strand:- start:3039 stop:4487 length:1449 start_codon:yes stop_codon:yes gene_type:complete